jgi:hypothetical protein
MENFEGMLNKEKVMQAMCKKCKTCVHHVIAFGFSLLVLTFYNDNDLL